MVIGWEERGSKERGKRVEEKQGHDEEMRSLNERRRVGRQGEERKGGVERTWRGLWQTCLVKSGS